MSSPGISMSPGISTTTSRTSSGRFPVPFFLLGMTLAGVPAPSAGSTPVAVAEGSPHRDFAPPGIVIEQQAADTLDHVAGIVRSEDGGTPLAGATVTVVSTGGSAITHGDGSFRIAVPDGERYRLRVDRIGYAAAAVDVRPGELAAVDLEVVAIPLPDVVVTAVLSPRAANETIRPSAVFAGEMLQRRLAATLAQTVESVPGVVVTSMGPGTSQPSSAAWAETGSSCSRTASGWATSSVAARTTPRRPPLPPLGASK